MHGPGGTGGTDGHASGRAGGEGSDRRDHHGHSTHGSHSRSTQSSSARSRTAAGTVEVAPVHTHDGATAVWTSRSGGSGFVAGLLLGLIGLSYSLYLFVDATPRWLVLLVAGFVLVAVAVLWRAHSSQNESTDEERDPVDRLRVQYASGEIDEEELERRLEELEAGGARFERLPGDEGTADGSDDRRTAAFESTAGGQYPTAGFDEPRAESPSTATRGSEGSARVSDEPASGHRETPEARLRRRFAAGEIDEATFTRKLAVLRETGVRADE